MCAATRFPEAIPLRKITAPVIIRALVKFFLNVWVAEDGTNWSGVPISCQSFFLKY